MEGGIVAKCWKCALKNNVSVIPVRNPDNSVIAFIFSCDNCLKYILGKSTTITIGDEEIINSYIN